MRAFLVLAGVLFAFPSAIAMAEPGDNQSRSVSGNKKVNPPSKFHKPAPYVVPQGDSPIEKELRDAIEADDTGASEVAGRAIPRRRVNASELPPTNRSYQDNPDTTTLQQVHFIYAVPQGEVDRGIDLTSLAPNSMSSANRWLASQIRRKFRVDIYQGHLDVSFTNLPNTDAYYESFQDGKLGAIEYDLRQQRHLQPNKLYVILYEGTNARTCADAFLGGQLSAVYLRGLEQYSVPCASVPRVNSATEAPGYHEFVFLHEIVHLTGAVSWGAPNMSTFGHVGDTSEDLMYTGPLGWSPAIVDFGNDDYYHRKSLRPDLFNLSNAPLLTKSRGKLE